MTYATSVLPVGSRVKLGSLAPTTKRTASSAVTSIVTPITGLVLIVPPPVGVALWVLGLSEHPLRYLSERGEGVEKIPETA